MQLMYSPLVYVAEGDTAWVDSVKEKTSNESLLGMCKVFIWCVSVIYLLPPLRLKQDVFPRYCDILYLCFHTFFFKWTFLCRAGTLCSHPLTCSCCLLKLSPCTQIPQSDEVHQVLNSAFRNTMQKQRSEKSQRTNNKARELRKGSSAFYHSWPCCLLQVCF